MNFIIRYVFIEWKFLSKVSPDASDLTELNFRIVE